MKTKLFTSLLLILALCVRAIAAELTVDEILAKHFEALGGKDKIAAIKTLKMTGKMELMQGMQAPFTIFVKNHDATRFEMEFQGKKMITSVQGDSGWFIQPWTGKTDPDRMPADQVKESKDQIDIGGPLFNYKEKGHTVELIGKEDMEGTQVYKLKLTKKDGDVNYIFIDATSFLQLKETSKHKMQDKEMESETIFSNYKKVEGVQFPFSVESRSAGGMDQGGGMGQTMTIDNIEVNTKIDDTMFKMPKKK